ncbi:MAG: ABC transporter substrate-binding protein [Deltaproteobacteria bacterium]|jgi:sn-glycerol 3-phosphate transport system substrate-binding protein|nr:ABC transporter substrate-binding protein [Deltaproteobacteria bacterium]MBW2529977.1 ABC transporter substrate-binding protein [Deltaproteobacteria bacterium]
MSAGRSIVPATSRRRLLGTAAAAVAVGAVGCGRTGAADRTEVSLWFSYGGNNRRVLLDLIDRFHHVQSSVRVVPTFQGDYFEGLAKLRTALFAGATPTLSHVVGEVVPYLYEAGALERLDEIGEDALADLVPSLAQQGTFVDGANLPTVALPFNRSTPIAYYNRTLFRDLRLEPPRTWDDLRRVARAATRRGAGGSAKNVERWGFECPVDWWFWVALVGQAGGELIRPSDGAVLLGGEAGAQAIELWQQMVHEDRSMKPPPGRDYDAWQATNTDFLAGRAAMIWTSTAFLRYLERNASFEVGAAPLPGNRRRSVPTGGTFFIMPRGRAASRTDLRRQRAAATFLRWMMAPAQANAWAMRTGYMPVSRSGLAELEQSGYYDDHPNDRVTIDQLAHAQPWPWAPTLFRVQREAVQPRLEEAVLLGRDARKTLAAARASLEEGAR